MKNMKKICFLDEDTAKYFKHFFGGIESDRFVKVPMGEADYLFYSPFTPDHHAAKSDTVKIMITTENICPDFNACDYAISGEYLCFGDRHLRIPVYATYEDAKYLASRSRVNGDDILKKTKFCNFVYSNNLLAHPIREQFFHAMNSVIPVVSAGRFLRNDESLVARNSDVNWVKSKIEFLQQFRFTIAIENSEHPGYITEKLTDALLARTVPIYWGDPLVAEEFNPEAFFHLRNFSNHSIAIAEMQRLNMDSESLLDMLNAPVFTGKIDRVSNYLTAAKDFIEEIFARPIEIARRRPRHGWSQWLEQKRRKDQTGIKRRFNPNRI